MHRDVINVTMSMMMAQRTVAVVVGRRPWWIPRAATKAGRLISGDGSDNKIQIGCNIRQLPQFVNV